MISGCRTSAGAAVASAFLVLSGCAGAPTEKVSSEIACCTNAAVERTVHLAEYLATRWLEPKERDKGMSANVRWIDHEGASGAFGDLRGQPVALSFIYTRCTNPNKCARVTRAMAELQEELQAAGLSDRVRLLLLTYDPEYDTAAILTQYAKGHGVKGDSALRLARMDSVENRKLLDELEAAVNFNNSGVNIHGIQLFLFDKQGRWVRTYKTLLWDHAAVLRDLQRLAAEPR